jgi:ABC-2 type transport system permease protein
LFGKLLPYAVIHTMVSLVLLLVWHGPLGNPVEGSFIAEWAALALMGGASLAIAVFIVGWSADYRLALSMGAFFGGPSLAFAGVTFPTAAMKGPALGWSSMLPLSHAIHVVMDQSVKGSSLRADLVPFLALVSLMAFFVGLSFVRWGHVLRDPAEWGQS